MKNLMKALIEKIIILVTIFCSPIWVIPYLLYRYKEIRRDLKDESKSRRESR